jgi:hypothetical protein
MNPATMRALVVLTAFLIGAALAGVFERAVKNAEIADLNAAWKAEKAKAAESTLARVSAANVRADKLAGQLAESESARQTQAQENQREIRRLTTGRPCLSGAVVRLLNTPNGLTGRALPKAASEPVRADAAAATDTDVALWADFARRAYDTCRGRLQAIADFYAGEQSPTAQTEAGDSARVCADCGN